MFKIISIEMKPHHFEEYGGTSKLTFKNSVYRMKIVISISNKEASKISPQMN
jgi:hypothetical protein